MKQQVKRVLSIGSTLVLSLATLIGIPLKSYIHMVNNNPECIDIGPVKWTPHMAKRYARGYMLMHYPEWNRSEWKALVKLWTAESNWRHQADNPKSTAYGIAQVLDTPPGTPAPQQVARGLAYIKHRYDKPSAAWSFHRKHNYY
jgi:hypothetical protein